MRNFAAAVFFVQQARINQRTGVLGNGFEIGIERLGELLNRNSVIFFNRKQNINSPVVGRPLKITLQLFCCFYHIFKITYLTQHSNILQNVGMLF